MTSTETTMAHLDEAQVRVDLAASFRLAAAMEPVSYTHLRAHET